MRLHAADTTRMVWFTAIRCFLLVLFIFIPGIVQAQSPLTTATNSFSLMVGVPFSQSFVGSGTINNFYVLTGSLPPGLAFSTSGTGSTGIATISGTPTSAGSFSFAVRVTPISATTSLAPYDSPFVMTVTDPPTPPEANSVAATVQANSNGNTIAASLTGGAVTALSIASAPAHGTATVSGLGFSYSPTTNYVGTDSFTYIATGPGGTSRPATISVNVVTTPPTAANATLAIPYGTAGSVDLASFISGPTFTGITVTISSQPANGKASVSGSRVTYTPNPGFFGTDQLSYVATAVGGQSTPAILSISVGGPPDPSQEKSVVGMLRTGATAVRHYQSIQIDSFQTRLMQLDSGTDASHKSGCEGFAAWVAGSGGNGTVGGRNNRAQGYHAQGLTGGADRCFGSDLTVGIGFGYGEGRSNLDGEGTAALHAATVSAYGTIRLLPKVQLGWMVASGPADFDYERLGASLDESLRGQWSGNQHLASFSTNYKLEWDDLKLTPYGRYDASLLEVGSFTESGSDAYALKYQGQRFKLNRLTIGLAGEYKIERDFGRIVPRLRLEYQHDYANRQDVIVSYAAMPASPSYIVAADENERRSTMLTIGGDVFLRGGLSFGFQHTFSRSNGGHESNMSQLRATQKF